MRFLPLIGLGVIALTSGCASVTYESAAGQPTIYTPTNETGPVAGIGIESQDIIAMTDQMMRDMLANPSLSGRSTQKLKRAGVVDGGTIRNTVATAGVDYKLGGRIASQDSLQGGSQISSRYSVVTFEMIDMELGTIVWSGIYEFKKTAQDNVIYR